MLLVLLLVCCVACVVISASHCWCWLWCIELLVLLIMFLSTNLSHTYLNHSPLWCWCRWIVNAIHHVSKYLFELFFLVLLFYNVSYYFHCMCFGEIIPPPPLPYKWCIGGSSCYCMSFVIRYPPLSFPLCCC
jgi:hypothetical protein